MAKKSTAPAPTPPNPFQVAQAQTGSNVETAIANSILGNANEITPWGNVNYRQIGTQTVGAPGGVGGSVGGGGLDPKFGGALGFNTGGGTGGGGFNVPQFERTVTLSPSQQAIFDQQNQLDQQLNQTAIDQAGRVSGALSTPFSTAGLPSAGNVDMGNRPNYLNNPTQTPNLQTSLGNTDFEDSRRRTEEAIYSRLEPQLDRQRLALENRLVNQGLTSGTEAFNRAIDAETRAANDARMQAVLAGGQEQSRLFDISERTGRFGNEALQQDFTNEFGQRQYSNDLAQRAYMDQMNIAARQDQQRTRATQEELAVRNQPLNEVAALTSGTQLQLPQFAQFNPSQMGQTPVGDYVYNSAALNNQNFQQQQAQRNAMMGGLFGLGSSALLGGARMFSDRRLKEAIRDTGIRLLNGLRLYLYRYLGDPVERVGFMADEVEQIAPVAVSVASGYKTVHHGMATQ